MKLAKKIISNKRVLSVSAFSNYGFPIFSQSSQLSYKIILCLLKWVYLIFFSSAIEIIPNLPPVFKTLFEYPIRIQKNLRLSSKIVKVSAAVEDGAEIVYSVEPNDWFEINSNSGWISLKKSLDDIAGSEISLIVKVNNF